jgi:uncharacterized membrane protein
MANDKRPEVNTELIKRIRRIIIEAGAPMIPMSVLFEQLGYTGMVGVGWGVLVGVISAIAIEFGYEITKFGSQVVLKKTDSKQGTSRQKDDDDTGEKK